ncbi:MAG: hypothetical protein HC781_13035 [Leptolyngbyaceae cyanobacterium CSU_1_4]|nr:hypothetical protein [Leptolyngbyaceae cyanobacterium CSU_1_4]
MRIRSFLWVISVTIICWWLVLPTLNTLKLPLGQTYGIVSRMVELGRNPSTNVAIYLLLLLIPNLIILGFATLSDRLKGLFSRIGVQLSHFLNHRTLPLIVGLVLIIWTLNATAPNSDYASTFPKDGFHFGEKIGLTAAYFQSPQAFFNQNYILIHGLGMNVLPGVVGRWLGGQDFDIAFTLYAVYLQSLLAIAFSFLILHEVAIFLAPQRRWHALLALSLIYFALHGTIFGFIDRDTVFLLQAYLTLRWLRFSHNEPDLAAVPQKRFNRRSLHPFLVAFLIPFSVLYVYDRAVYAIAIFVCTLIYLLITTNKQQFVKAIAISLAGFLTAALLISFIFGFQVLPNALSQIRYWSKVSGLFTALPYPAIDLSISSLINWVPIFLQSLTLTGFCLSLREECLISNKKIQIFLKENYLPLFLFLSAVFYMRVALGRSDGGHLISPGFFAIFAFIALVSHIITERRLFQISWQTLILTTFIATSLFNLNSVFAAVNLKQLSTYPAAVHALLTQTNTDLVAPDQLIVARRLQERLKSQSCFYTLTSEGLWYELLDQPPCSRYWYLIYAPTKETQKQVVQDLKKTKPKIILYSGGFGDILDGIPKEASHLRVHQYIWQRYRPGFTLQNRWFWIRRSGSSNFTELLVPQPNLVSGYFDGISKSEEAPNQIAAGGWAISVRDLPGAAANLSPDQSLDPDQKPPQENVILLTANPVGQPNQVFPINVGQTSLPRPDVAAHLGQPDLNPVGWAISTHQLGLPVGNFEMKAWIYNSIDYKFYQIPQAHPFEVDH